MIMKRTTLVMAILACLLFLQKGVCGEYPEGSLAERQEYKQDFNRINSLDATLSQPNKVRDLKAYEKFANDIEKKWRHKNRVYYARLMLKICGPLSSGIFKERRQHELAREYALSALEMPNDIPLITELELIGSVMTNIIGTGVSKGEEFSKRRKKDTSIRLHAWKRLINAIDPKWNPNEFMWGGNVPPPEATGLSPGVDPKAIKDAKLRKEYEDAIQCNKQKVKKHVEQSKLRRWIKKFPKRAEKYIVRMYSHPPFDIEELKKMLDGFPDQKAKARIVSAVAKNMQGK